MAAAVTFAEPASVAADWRVLQDADPAMPPYLTWQWLDAWEATHAPARLRALRVGDLALGLVEDRGRGRLRFAGWPVAPVRGLLCAPGAEREAWAALATWLREGAGVAQLDAEGLGADAAAALAGWSLSCEPAFSRALPASAAELLAGSGNAGLRRKLRAGERAGAEVRPGGPGAVERFLELHAARARQKGERHDAMGPRLAGLLARLGDGPPAVRVLELHVAGEVAGVTVRLDAGDTGWFYNAGVDPAHLGLSPGYLLEIASMHDAVERGLRRFDLGPGEYRYKRDLGGEERESWTAVGYGPSAGARAARLAGRVRPLLRRVARR